MVEKPDKLDTHAFSFRRGKRLLSRYPPGHVAGIEMFFKFHKQRIDEDLQPKLILAICIHMSCSFLFINQ